MSKLTHEQLANIRRIKRTPEYRRASPRERKAVLEAAGVESNYRHVRGGDRDSSGILQQRPSQGWGPASETIEQDVAQFLQRARKLNRRGFRGSAGQLAQAIQRSAFPERYDQRSKEAERLMGRSTKGGRSAGSGKGRTVERTRLVRGGTKVDEQGALVDALLDHRRGGSLLKRYEGRLATGAYTTETPDRVVTTTTRTKEKGYGLKGKAAKAKGGRVIHELFWNGPGAVNVKEGKRVGKGFVDGHTDHAHYAGNRDDVLAAARLAQDMGLHVSELDPFDKVDPVHAKNSWHYRKRAVDVSGDPRTTAKWARRVARGDF